MNVMLWNRKKRIPVMCGKRFVAAFSESPFVEERDGARYPDYSFHTVEGMHWCVRIGDIEVPWGFAPDEHAGIGFSAFGVITVSRRNVSAVTFDGRGLPYVRRGEIFYLFENEFENGFFGFSIYLRDRLLGSIKALAADKTADAFREALPALDRLEAVRRTLDEHKLVFKEIRIQRVNQIQTGG